VSLPCASLFSCLPLNIRKLAKGMSKNPALYWGQEVRISFMNVRAMCSNSDCAAFGREKSVVVGTVMGYGAPNDRVKCPECGGLMTTTKSIYTAGKGRGKSSSHRSSSKRSPKR
jgi:hypothetical protein